MKLPIRLICASIVFFNLVAWGDEKQLISIDDLYRFDGPTAVAVAPDGESVTYARRWADREQRRIRFSLWRVQGDATNAKPMEQGEPDARAPFYSPDEGHPIRSLPHQEDVLRRVLDWFAKHDVKLELTASFRPSSNRYHER